MPNTVGHTPSLGSEGKILRFRKCPRHAAETIEDAIAARKPCLLPCPVRVTRHSVPLPRNIVVADPTGLGRIPRMRASRHTPCCPETCVASCDAPIWRPHNTHARRDHMADHIRDVMTQNLQTLPASATVREAAEAMRANDIGDVIAMDDKGGVVGIVTDRDVVVRVVADFAEHAGEDSTLSHGGSEDEGVRFAAGTPLPHDLSAKDVPVGSSVLVTVTRTERGEWIAQQIEHEPRRNGRGRT